MSKLVLNFNSMIKIKKQLFVAVLCILHSELSSSNVSKAVASVGRVKNLGMQPSMSLRLPKPIMKSQEELDTARLAKIYKAKTDELAKKAEVEAVNEIWYGDEAFEIWNGSAMFFLKVPRGEPARKVRFDRAKKLPDNFIAHVIETGSMDDLRDLLIGADRPEIAMMFLKNSRINALLSPSDLGFILISAAVGGHAEIVALLLEDSRFNAIDMFDVGGAFVAAARRGHAEIVAMLLASGRSDVITLYIDWAFFRAVENDREKIVELLLSSDQFKEISEDYVRNALGVAKEKKFTGIVHLIEAYTALKPESALFFKNETGKDMLQATYPIVASQFIDTYKEFLKGRPDDLRNLVFPVARDLYALAPQKDVAMQSMRVIAQTLQDIFKRDHIKSLLFTLVEKNYQKTAAMELLDLMGLSNRVKNAQERAETFQQMPFAGK